MVKIVIADTLIIATDDFKHFDVWDTVTNNRKHASSLDALEIIKDYNYKVEEQLRGIRPALKSLNDKGYCLEVRTKFLDFAHTWDVDIINAGQRYPQESPVSDCTKFSADGDKLLTTMTKLP